MTCADLEILLCDYLDGTLAAGERSAVERHLADCPACGELARDAGAAMALAERSAEIEPPAALVNRILYETSYGRGARKPAWSVSLRGWYGRLVSPLLAPRFVMGLALTMFSLFTMLHRIPGLRVRQLTPSDVNPVKVWAALDDRAHRAWERSVKFYESLRLVYEVETRLREWREQEADRDSAEQDAGAAGDRERVTPSGQKGKK